MKTYRSRSLKRRRSRAERDSEINAQVCSILNSCNIRLLKIRTNIKIKIRIKIKRSRRRKGAILVIVLLILTIISVILKVLQIVRVILIIRIDNQTDIPNNNNSSSSNSSNSNNNSNIKDNRHLNNIIEIGRLLSQLWINHTRISIKASTRNRGKKHNNSNRMSRKILSSMILNSRN